MSVLVATDAAAVAGVEEATTVVRTAEAGRTAVDVATGAEDLPRSRASPPTAAECTKSASWRASPAKRRASPAKRHLQHAQN
eukprot:4393304-Pleurochrysis_carterae.AAC.1